MSSDQSIKPEPEIDLGLLSEILLTTRLHGGLFMHAEFSAPWCMASEFHPERFSDVLDGAVELVCYHYLLEGEVEFKFDGAPPFKLKSGEAILVPRNDSHFAGSDVNLPATPGQDLVTPPNGAGLFNINHGGGGEPAIFVCGFIGSRAEDFNPLIRSLPPVIVVKFENEETDAWVRSSFRFGADESASLIPGASKQLARLSELLLMQAVKSYAMRLPANETSWLRGLRDRHVAKAMALIHGDVARKWTMTELSREVGLSRSALSHRFHKLVGVPPMQYLASQRMLKAGQLLSTPDKSIAEVAATVGYGSYEAFARAFKSHYGNPPATWRA